MSRAALSQDAQDRNDYVLAELAAAGARPLWQVTIPRVGTLDAYMVNGRVVLFQRFHSGGVELYTAHQGNNLKDSLAFVGLKAGA